MKTDPKAKPKKYARQLQRVYDTLLTCSYKRDCHGGFPSIDRVSLNETDGFISVSYKGKSWMDTYDLRLFQFWVSEAGVMVKDLQTKEIIALYV